MGGVAHDTCLCCPYMFGPVSTLAHTIAAVPQITRLFLTHTGHRRHEGRHRSAVHSRLGSLALHGRMLLDTLFTSLAAFVTLRRHDGRQG